MPRSSTVWSPNRCVRLSQRIARFDGSIPIPATEPGGWPKGLVPEIWYDGFHMHALKVQVVNGRLKIDEPTDLPEGAEVEVLVIDDDLSTEERAELHASLERALDDSEAGRGVDAWEFLKQHRARRENSSA